MLHHNAADVALHMEDQSGFNKVENTNFTRRPGKLSLMPVLVANKARRCQMPRPCAKGGALVLGQIGLHFRIIGKEPHEATCTD